MTKTRLPPTWLVLLPALALAAVGVRAVMAEMRASQDAARERARSVASRLARSVDALVEEYAAPLPERAPDLPDDEVIAKTAPHLDACGLYDTRVARRDGVRTTVWSPLRTQVDKGETCELVRDAVARADEIAKQPGGPAAAAALLAATAPVVESVDDDRERGLRWPLRLAQARFELRAGDAPSALETLRHAASWQYVPCEFDGVDYPEAVLRMAAELTARDAPIWLVEAYERCARSPVLVTPEMLRAIEHPFGDALPERMTAARRLNSVIRRLVSLNPDGDIHAAVMTVEGGKPRLSLWRTMTIARGPGRTVLGGEIPQSVVEDRIGKEVAALAAEPGVATVRLATSAGEHAFDTTGATANAKDLVVESVPLADSLSTWRAEAVVAPESGVPATAWLLAAAVVVMTGALLWGAVALRRAAERSARLAEERRTFLDHVAHELRTPAAAVQALSEELASGHVAAQREPEYRKHLLRESRRLSGLVDDTLDFARLDAGRLAFKTAPADLRDVVRQAVEESDGAGRVVAKLPDAPVVRDVDAAALRRAVKNLVENAAKHGGGDAPIDVALEASNGHASIVVADHGRGIAAEHLPRIFERFYRVPSATHETKGVGLGLALCREIARAHGGDVDVASEVGKGSTFTLKVPMS